MLSPKNLKTLNIPKINSNYLILISINMQDLKIPEDSHFIFVKYCELQPVVLKA